MAELQLAINRLHLVLTSSHLPGWKENRQAWQVVLNALSTRDVTSGTAAACWCETCRPITLADMRMVLCPVCGNKRCPHATFHGNACTASNDPGQPGSSYEHCGKSYVLHAMTGQPLPDWLKDLVVRHEDGREVPIVGLYVLENESIEEALLRGLPPSCSIVRRAQEAGEDATFQAGVAEWMGKCFIPSLYSNMTERGDRLLEEVLELLQAHGYDRSRVATLVDYVYGRPVGEPAQEVGGVMVTLAGFCWVAGLDMHAAGAAELARITQPEVMARIRAKQEAKNALHFDTPLPGYSALSAQHGEAQDG